MKNQKLYNVKFIKGELVEDIKMAESLMWELLEEYTGEKLEETEQDYIIKVFLPSNKEKALEVLNNGIDYEGNHYIAFLTSPSMMKKEEGQFKCQYLFIKEDLKDFKNEYRDVISAGMINKLYNADKVCINKDITARESLSLSASHRIKLNPYVLVLGETEYNHVAKYSTFRNGKLVDEELTKAFTFSDGCELASPSFMDKIEKELELGYKLDFIGFRHFPLASKGLAIRADFVQYFKDNYKEDNDYIKRSTGTSTFKVKDYYGNWIDISKVDMIINTTQAKWAKLYNGEKFDDINDFIQEKISPKYREQLNSIYITKFNKKAPNEYTKINYQVLNNVALTVEELKEIQRPTREYYEKIISFTDENILRQFMGDLTSADADEDEESEDEVKEINLRSSTKVHQLLQIDGNFKNTREVKREIIRNIEKKLHHLITRPYVKGNFKVACADPVAMLDFAMTGEIIPCLKEGEFYVPRETGKRVLTRNPLGVFSEVHQIELSKNVKIDKYFGNLTSEIIFFNQVDNMAFISSGEDFDTDVNGVWDSDILYNAVIPAKDGYNFNFEADGKKKEVKWSIESEYEAVLEASGNLIGKLSNILNKISSECNEVGYLIGEKWFSYRDIKETIIKKLSQNDDQFRELNKRYEALKKNIDDLKEAVKNGEYDLLYSQYEVSSNKLMSDWKEELKKVKAELYVRINATLEQLKEQGRIKYCGDLPAEQQRKYIMENFHKNREKAYYGLQLSQIAIDAPKTLVLPTNEEIKILKSYTKLNKHPRFLFNDKFTMANKKEIELDDVTFTNCALDIASKKIEKELIKPIKDIKINENRTRIDNLLKEIAIEHQHLTLEEEIMKLKELNKAIGEKTSGLSKEESSKIWAREQLAIIDKMKELRKEYTDDEIAHVIVKLKLSVSFIFRYCWDIVETAIASKERDTVIYKEDNEGVYDYMFKRYSKVPAKLILGQLQEQSIEQIKRKAGYVELSIGGIKDVNIATGTDISIVKSNYINKKGEKKVSNDVYIGGAKVGFIYPSCIKKELKDNYKIINTELKEKYIKIVAE